MRCLAVLFAASAQGTRLYLPIPSPVASIARERRRGVLQSRADAPPIAGGAGAQPFERRSGPKSRGERPAGRAELLAKKRHTDLVQNPAKLRRFWIRGGIRGGIIRNFRKMLHFSKNPEKIWSNLAKIQQNSGKICEISGKQQQKKSAIFNEIFEIRERCKGVHCVDLGESFPTSI